MGDIASGRHRFVAGCARSLRMALAGIYAPDDEDGLAETQWTRQGRGLSFTLAGVRLATSMAVARGSDRLRAALASIPVTDDEGGAPGGDRAGQADLRRRVALASPAVAAGLFAGAVTTTPAGAQEAPASAAAAPAQNPSPPPTPPPTTPPDPPRSWELVAGAGLPWGGEIGVLLNDDGTIQLTTMGGFYRGAKAGLDLRQARAPGFVGEAKLQGALGPARAEAVAQGNLSGIGGSAKVQLGPAYGGASAEIVPNPQIDWRAGLQQRAPSWPQSQGFVGAVGGRYTTDRIPVNRLVEDWQNSQPIDPARFEGVPAPEDPYVRLIEWLSDQFGSQGSSQTSAPPDWSEAGELGGAYGDQIGVPGATAGSGGLLGQYMEQVGASGAPVGPPQLDQRVVDAWNEFAESADPSGGLSATAPSPDDLALIGDALSQLWGQLTGTAPPPALAGVPAPLPALPPAFDQLIAQDPALAQRLAQLVPQDPALSQLIVQDPALARLLAEHPGLAQALAQDPTLAPALSQALAPAPAPAPGMDWGQVMQDMNGPVLVDPGLFQDQPSSYTDEGVDVPAFETYDAESPSDAESETEPGGEESESEDADDGDEPSDDWTDEEDFETDDDAEESESDDDGGEEQSESDDDGDQSDDDSDDDGEDESDGDESDDGGDDGDESDDGSDEDWEDEEEGGDEDEGDESDGGGDESDGGGDESDGGGDESESDGGGGGESDGGGGGGGDDSVGEGGAPDAQAPADPPDAGSEGGGEEPRGDGYDYGDFDEGPGVEQDVGGGDISPEQAA
jgi:hypothetical protein